jgi:hypothetical protein
LAIAANANRADAGNRHAAACYSDDLYCTFCAKEPERIGAIAVIEAVVLDSEAPAGREMVRVWLSALRRLALAPS